MKIKFSFLFLIISQIGITQVLKNINAEDLWGNPININNIVKSKTTVIIPFSTSNCGYCLIDGYFSKLNYLMSNNEMGGASFEQSLFNTQLDIYTFTKEFQSSFPVLTYPPQLYDIHENGFPTVLAFKKGKQLVKYHNNYAEFDKLNALLWDNKCHFRPTGNNHMADKLFFENEIKDAFIVVPDDFTIEKDEWIDNSAKYKHIGELTKEDKQKHLYIAGRHNVSSIASFFTNKNNIISFSNDSILVGEYKFKFDSIGILAWLYNPYNPEKYLMLDIRNGHKRNGVMNYLDFVVYTGADSISCKKLMYGHYNISNNGLEIIPEKTFSDVSIQKYCNKVCNVPQKPKKILNNVNKNSTISITKSQYGQLSIIGNKDCRFPDLASDEEGNVWVVFEENGDIVLNKVEANSKPIFIEYDESDSYSPKIICENNKIWIFYLNNRDSYYRLYARFIENGNLSDEIILSEKAPFNVCNINATSKNGEISVVWTEWKANYRFLKYRKIIDGILLEIQNIPLAPPIYTENYYNAWGASIAYSKDGTLWGAWNQHYPASFGVIGGKIGDKPSSITSEEKEMDDWENGGYPCIIINGNEKNVFYESSAWDVLNGDSQTIKFRQYNDSLKKWTFPVIISNMNDTYLNQTPSAISDENNNIYVAWSGRQNIENSVWGIYFSKKSKGSWSKPILISPSDTNARYPKIILNKKDNSVWISWHSGIGENMKIKVINLDECK